MRKVKEIKSKLGAIRNTLEDSKLNVADVYDTYLDDLPSTNSLFGKTLDQFKNKKLKKRENKKDIFSELLEIVETFVGTDKNVKLDDKFQLKQIIKQHISESIKATVKESKSIIQDSVKNTFFAGEGICGGNSKLPLDKINLSPKEIDFMNILTVDPTSNIGKILYEPQSSITDTFNRDLYNIFTNGSFDFKKNNGETLFSINWDIGNQEFEISGLKQSGDVSVDDFFNEYFSSISFPDLSGITKSAMLLTIQGDNQQTLELNLSLNKLDRLLNKLFSICGQPTNRSNIKNQNPTDLIDENEEDIDSYFDFDDVNEADTEAEDARIRGVLKFIDCNNFEIPINNNNIEDFVYFSEKKNLNDIVNETLEKTANDVYEKSDKSINALQFKLSLLNNFNLKLPKALILSILTPKLFLPIVAVYKMFKSISEQKLDIAVLMRKLSKLFYNIIKGLFWKFITEFWTKIKAELLAFVKNFSIKIVKDKYKRYVNILTAIFQSLKKVGIKEIDNCENLFNIILQTLESTSMLKGKPKIPGLLLAASSALPGLSKVKMMADVIEFLESKNIPTGDINGEKNDLISTIDSVYGTLLENLDKYSFIDASNKPIVLTSPSGPVVVPPGIFKISGKLF
jgi:hypothetical protein